MSTTLGNGKVNPNGEKGKHKHTKLLINILYFQYQPIPIIIKTNIYQYAVFFQLYQRCQHFLLWSAKWHFTPFPALFSSISCVMTFLAAKISDHQRQTLSHIPWFGHLYCIYLNDLYCAKIWILFLFIYLNRVHYSLYLGLQIQIQSSL